MIDRSIKQLFSKSNQTPTCAISQFSALPGSVASAIASGSPGHRTRLGADVNMMQPGVLALPPRPSCPSMFLPNARMAPSPVSGSVTRASVWWSPTASSFTGTCARPSTRLGLSSQPSSGSLPVWPRDASPNA